MQASPFSIAIFRRQVSWLKEESQHSCDEGQDRYKSVIFCCMRRRSGEKEQVFAHQETEKPLIPRLVSFGIAIFLLVVHSKRSLLLLREIITEVELSCPSSHECWD